MAIFLGIREGSEDEPWTIHIVPKAVPATEVPATEVVEAEKPASRASATPKVSDGRRPNGEASTSSEQDGDR
jgi:hypothetical protein